MPATTLWPLPGMVFDDVHRGWHYPDYPLIRMADLFGSVEIGPQSSTWTVTYPPPSDLPQRKRKRHKKRGKP